MKAIFKRRERAEQATANPPELCAANEAEAAEPCTQCAARDVEIEYWMEVARTREVMRAQWERMWRDKCADFARLHTRTDEAERKLRGVEADLWMRDGQIENQAAQIVALEKDLAQARDDERAARRARDLAKQETAVVVADREKLRRSVHEQENLLARLEGRPEQAVQS